MFEDISPINTRNTDQVQGSDGNGSPVQDGAHIQGAESAGLDQSAGQGAGAQPDTADLVQGAGALPPGGLEAERFQTGPKADDTDITFTKGTNNGNISDTMQKLATSTPLPPSPHQKSQTQEDRVKIPEYLHQFTENIAKQWNLRYPYENDT